MLARLRAIWCAARWIAPIEPVITVATLNAPTSKIYWRPEANPILKISLIWFSLTINFVMRMYLLNLLSFRQYIKISKNMMTRLIKVA